MKPLQFGQISTAEPHRSVGSLRDLRSEVTGLITGLSHYSFQRLMVINPATGFIPLSLLSIVLALVIWENNWFYGKNIVWGTGKKNSMFALGYFFIS